MGRAGCMNTHRGFPGVVSLDSGTLDTEIVEWD